jgi:uncharacterized membrane protein YhaH (DUF805 family)
MKWYFRVLKQYATFRGRAQRREYWMFVLWNILSIIGSGMVGALIGVIVALTSRNEDGIFEIAIGLPIIVYPLAVLIPSIAVAIRRMHDTGRSGWWILFPVVNFILVCMDSKPGDNKYGPNPKLAEPYQQAARAT